MRYIRIDPKSLEAEIVKEKGKRAVFVPLKRDRSGSALTDMLHYTVYFDVLYPLVEARDHKRGVKVSYKLPEPDPWLIALAAIMWQGLIQGLTWDTIKALSLVALNRLREVDLAPVQVPTRAAKTRAKKQSRHSRTEVGFSWTKFSDEGLPLYQFFLGVKRRFRKSTEEERIELPTATHMKRRSRV